MSRRKLRVALAQINPTLGDLDGNTSLICEHIERAKAAGAELVAFPELCVSGYPPEDLLLRPHFIADCIAQLPKIAAAAKGITAVVGAIRRQGNSVYNAAQIFHRGRKSAAYRKQILPNYGVFDEKRYFQPGTGNDIWQLGEAILGISVCEDIWLPDGPFVDISSSPYHAGKHRERMKMLHTRARATGTFVCYVNTVGGQDELIFDGGSMIISPSGRLLAEGRLFEEDMVIHDIDTDEATRKMFKAESSPNLRKHRLKAYRRTKPMPLHLPHLAPRYNRWEEVYRALMLGLRDYVEKNRFDKVVTGMSGGVDSTLATAVAVDALGADRVIGVTMPSQYTSEGTLADAGKAAERLGIRLITLPIEEKFKTYIENLSEVFAGQPEGTTEENIQARIRGNLLMALSNKFGWLVVTAGNKSETSVGYATLYGDMAGGFALLKDVPKTWVYELCRQRNDMAGTDLIPEGVIRRAPSAELRPNQTDQDTLPPYDILDAIIDAYVEQDMSRAEIAAMGFEQALVERIAKMIDRNEYKRRQAPPGLKITPKAFGRDRRMPITNKYS